MFPINPSQIFQSTKDYRDLFSAFEDINFEQYIKLKTRREIEKIPSFIASNNNNHTITNVSKSKYDEIRKILSFYDDQSFDIVEVEDDIILNKKDRKIVTSFPVSKMVLPNFHETFEIKKIFEPIIIETDKKNSLGTNLEILVKALIVDPHISFEEDIDFQTLKQLFNFKGEDTYVIKKNDIQNLQKYCQTFNIFDYVDSEKLRLGVLTGITDFRVGNTLCDVRNRVAVAARDFMQLYIYAIMLHEIMNIRIDKLVIISPISGEEYSMKFDLKTEYTELVKNYQKPTKTD